MTEFWRRPVTPPRSARLVTRATGARPPRPPWGLRAWTAEAEVVVVWLDATGADMNEPAAILEQLPDPASLPPGTAVHVLPDAARVPRGWHRFFGARRVAVPRAARCEALLLRGYVDIRCLDAAAADAALASGNVPAMHAT